MQAHEASAGCSNHEGLSKVCSAVILKVMASPKDAPLLKKMLLLILVFGQSVTITPAPVPAHATAIRRRFSSSRPAHCRHVAMAFLLRCGCTANRQVCQEQRQPSDRQLQPTPCASIRGCTAKVQVCWQQGQCSEWQLQPTS